MARTSLLRLLLLICALSGTASSAQPPVPYTISTLKQMSLDELMNIEVTSASRTTERYAEAAAALTVVTAEHLRRSGATTVPDALRWVPGLHIAQQDANTWAMSSRGFSSVNSEKLLVLSDSRSIYTPLVSGVLWAVQDYLMADIERIEVIRGPGAALWGSNAVNGVINITTKHAADTHGTLVDTTVGTEERASIAVRHGARTAGGIHYRVFGQYVERDATFNQAESSDDWRLGHLGFRADWTGGADDEFTLQGDIYRGNIGHLTPAIEVIGRPGPTGNQEAKVFGGNLLGRWQRQLAPDNELQLRAYYDYTRRDDPSYTDDLDTFDIDLQHRFWPAARHQLVWGLNYRHATNRNEGLGIFAVRPPTSRDQIVSAFVQDQIAVHDDVQLTLGTKAEHNDFSGFELQPNARASWDITATHTLWIAFSRAARIPTRLERDIYVDATDPAGDPVYRLLGNRDFDAEDLRAAELGWRWRAAPTLQFDLALFENHYDGLASLELGDPFTDETDGRTVIPIFNRNLTDGRASGAELLATWSPVERWRLSASYSYLDLELDPAGLDLNRGVFYDGATPRHQFSLNSYLTLPGGLEFDAHFRNHSSLRRLPPIVTGEGLPGYSELDLRLAWRMNDQLTLSLVGRNLLHDHHAEFGSAEARGELERSVHLRCTWQH